MSPVASASRVSSRTRSISARARRPVGFQHLRVAREYGHAGSDDGLREVDRSDVLGLQAVNRRGELAVQSVDEVAVRHDGDVWRTRPAGQNDRVSIVSQPVDAVAPSPLPVDSVSACL